MTPTPEMLSNARVSLDGAAHIFLLCHSAVAERINPADPAAEVRGASKPLEVCRHIWITFSEISTSEKLPMQTDYGFTPRLRLAAIA